jgi:ankyrin repeat protein
MPAGAHKIHATVYEIGLSAFQKFGLAAGFFALVACESRQAQALRELKASGIEATDEALHQAVANRDHKTSARLLESGVSGNSPKVSGAPPLASAVKNRDADSMIMLLNAGADPSAKIGERGHILGIAAATEQVDQLNLLLAAGADPNGEMPDGEAVIIWAIRHGHEAIIASILRSGTNPNLKDLQGNPLLHVAMTTGKRALVESLLEIGADPTAHDIAGNTTIHHAIDQKWHDMIPRLVTMGANPNTHNREGTSPLSKALSLGDVRLFKSLLEIGADPLLVCSGTKGPSVFELAYNQKDNRFFEPLIDHVPTPPGGWDAWLGKTFEQNNIGKARLLFSHGIMFGENFNRSKLVEIAARAGMMDFVKLFLDYGFPAGRALEEACRRGDHQTASLLLTGGASANTTRTPYLASPLSMALRGGHDQLASILLQHGADHDAIMPEGQRALHVAIARGCNRTVRTIIGLGADPNTPFTLPVSKEFLNIVREGAMRWILLNDSGATPLMMAIDSGNIETAQCLIEAGANMSVRTRRAWYWPLSFAARRNDVRMMRLVLGKDPHREERHVEIRLAEQIARVYDATGAEIFSTKVSTGRRGYRTPTGEFVISNKYRSWTSTIYHSSMPFFQRLSGSDFGLHQGNLPGYPASHGCIRLPAKNAAKLFSMTSEGDRVRIVP